MLEVPSVPREYQGISRRRNLFETRNDFFFATCQDVNGLPPCYSRMYNANGQRMFEAGCTADFQHETLLHFNRKMGKGLPERMVMCDGHYCNRLPIHEWISTDGEDE